MQINYNITGEKRKSLVNAISQELNASSKYLGAPTFAYEVAGYNIDKNGVLMGNDNYELVEDLQGLYDFKAVTEEYDSPIPESEPVPEGLIIPYEAALGGRVSPYRDFEEPSNYGAKEEVEETSSIDNLELSIPMDGHSGTTLKNIVNMLSSKQHLIMKSIGIEEKLMDGKFAEDLSLKTTTTLDEFKVAVEEIGTERCKGITFDFENNIYTYNIPSDNLAYEKISSFAVLAARINEFAKEQKRTSYKVTQDDNPKFALRT
ncbi:MAG TPA: hypothetical protein PKH42_08960, partial [Sedimentibacter sp.]|nr:hypothetical protein [Sedimentibacter sp.]